MLPTDLLWKLKNSFGGYTLIKAESYDDAVELAKGCPILSVGGNRRSKRNRPDLICKHFR